MQWLQFLPYQQDLLCDYWNPVIMSSLGLENLLCIMFQWPNFKPRTSVLKIELLVFVHCFLSEHHWLSWTFPYFFKKYQTRPMLIWLSRYHIAYESPPNPAQCYNSNWYWFLRPWATSLWPVLFINVNLILWSIGF